jgi:SOS response regulatory protein OraA/RecX
MKEFEKELEDAGFATKWINMGEARGEAKGEAKVLNLLKKTGYDTSKLEIALKKSR